MKKRILAILLGTAMIMSVLPGCQGSADDAAQGKEDATAQETAEEETEGKTKEKEQKLVDVPEDIGLDIEKLDMSYPVRVVITTDGEVDDTNSMRHILLYANELDLEGLVYSASQFHWQGDGEHTLSEITPDYMGNGDTLGIDMDTAKEFRPQEMGWIEKIIQEEYAVDYTHLAENDPDYPTPEELLSIVKVGNVEFEGDVREATEGSDWVKDCILSEDPRPVYVQAWGGFNTVARALLSIEEEYGDTDQWEEIYEKVCSKTVIQGNGQDKTYNNYIQELYPDLVIYSPAASSYGYNSAFSAPEHAVEMFNSEWLTENIKFDHGAMMSNYRLIGDGTHYEGEPDLYQFGERLSVDWSGNGNAREFDQYDWLAEGDSIHWIGLIPTGLRALEYGNYGGWAGRLTVNGTVLTRRGNYKELDFTGQMSEFSAKRWLVPLQEDWAARADWTVGSYEECNHAPEVSAAQLDITAKKGETVDLEGSASDPDGDELQVNWWVYADACEYYGEETDLQVSAADQLKTQFTVPEDAEAGDYFNIVLEVKDDAAAPMTRYAQVIVTVTE